MGSVVISICIAVVTLATTRGSQAQNSPACPVVQQALLDHDRIKAGITRREVEKYFVQDGGAQFPGTSRYVYPRCRYLHVDIDFDAKASEGHLFSPEDAVTKASKLYGDYSAKD